MTDQNPSPVDRLRNAVDYFRAYEMRALNSESPETHKQFGAMADDIEIGIAELLLLSSSLASAREERDRLSRIMDKLPKLKCGSTAYPGRAVLVGEERELGEVAVNKYSDMLAVRVFRPRMKGGNGGYTWSDLLQAVAESPDNAGPAEN